MAEGRHNRAHSTRNRDRWLALLIVVLAAVSGALAGHFGTPRSWERSTGGTATPEVVQLQGSR
jgi:hypothetical protein